ncbi:MAG: hypothetical protein ACTSPG_08725 [Candidatus Hodarchaeales archaeon]
MPLFEPPIIENFFNGRLIISWKISTPSENSNLRNILIKVSGEPPLEFNPPQQSQITLPLLDDSDVFVNWIINKPDRDTLIKLTFSSDDLLEEHEIKFSPSANE